MASLTRRGALSVTTDLDRIANLFQNQHDVLGVPKEYATKFAYYCDVLSDSIEKHAIKLAEEQEKSEGAEPEEGKKEAAAEGEPEEVASPKDEDKGEEESKKEASAKTAQDDETGLSVDHGESGYDANAVADQVAGPLEILAPVESWMNTYFGQNWFSQLREKQQGGDIGFFVSASVARLRRLASVSALTGLLNVMKTIHAKLSASEMAEVKALASDVKKQIDACAKACDIMIAQQATGMVEPEVVVACDRIAQAVTEQIPYLKQVVGGVDGGSPVALLEFQRMVGGGSLAELVALGASIVTDAAKNIGKKSEDKEAAKAAGEVPEAFKKNWDKGEDDKDKDKDEGEKKEAKEAEEKPESEEDEETAAKTATFGYDLFTA